MKDPITFITRWMPSNNSETSNARLFIDEFCDLLGVSRPNPYDPENNKNTYYYDRGLFVQNGIGETEQKRVVVCKKGCFVLECKQGRDAVEESPRKTVSSAPVRGTRPWCDMMQRGWRRAEKYVLGLPPDEDRPPFVIVADVGYCFDLYTDFSCTGGLYLHYPDPRSHRTMLSDLQNSDVLDRLRSVWLDPMSLDLSRRAAKTTEEVAVHLASLARSLETDGHDPTLVGQFLMRCIFTMFAQNMRILAENAFTDLLEKCLSTPDMFVPLLRNWWESTNRGGWSVAGTGCNPRFDDSAFTDTQILPLSREQLSKLHQTARANWMEVEPAIFGTLLERALDPKERHMLGAHYTPRAFVERLVIPTIIQSLREDWEDVQAAARLIFESGKKVEVCKSIRNYHDRLCMVRVLDPACGSGNFLYVTMEHMLRLEGEVFQTMASYGDDQPCHLKLSPSQFFGLEINPQAAAIAELVLWIGYLRWHLKTYGDVAPPDPFVRKLDNIQRKDALIAYKSRRLAEDENGKPIERWDGATYVTDPVTGRQVPDESVTTVDVVYEGVTAAEWPSADFIVGNPPFVGNKRMRLAFGGGYTEALRNCYKELPGSCDLAMYWWHKAAQLVRSGISKRFGLITTNSITQLFNRRVVSDHLSGHPPLRLVYALPDHPWVDSSDGASVRISMTVADLGDGNGALNTVVSETEAEGREMSIVLHQQSGVIHSDLRCGTALTDTVRLNANRDICSHGVVLYSSGFIVTQEQAKLLGLGRVCGLERHIRDYRSGRDITNRSRDAKVIDLRGLTLKEVNDKYPEVYRWILARVKPEKDAKARQTKVYAEHAKRWWLFGSQRTTLRAALDGLSRYIATVYVSKHRCFVFLPTSILPDDTLVAVASGDAFHLGVLSSHVHVCWSLAKGGTLVDRPIYNNSQCFSTFPFPNASNVQKNRIRKLGEEIDQHRQKQQNLHQDLSLTGMYNVLETLRSGRSLTAKEQHIHTIGLVSVLRKLHDELDSAVVDAYGWPTGLPDDEILTRIVSLNAERADEERNGLVRWLRPEFQTKTKELGKTKRANTRFLSSKQTTTPVTNKPDSQKRPWPSELLEQINAVSSVVKVLRTTNNAVNTNTVVEHFVRPLRTRVKDILQTLEWLGLV